MYFSPAITQAGGGIETTQRNKDIRSSLPVMKGVEGGRNKGRGKNFEHKLFQ